MINYYKILGIENFSNIDLVKKTYRKLAMITHPDRGGNEKKFIEINDAYEKLKDQNYKETYDNSLKKYLEELNRPKEKPNQNNNSSNNQKANGNDFIKNSNNTKNNSSNNNYTKKQEQDSNKNSKYKEDYNEKSDEYYNDFTRENYEKYKAYFYNSKRKNNNQNYVNLEEENEYEYDDEDDYEYYYENQEDNYYNKNYNGSLFRDFINLFLFIWKIFKYLIGILKFIFSKNFIIFSKNFIIFLKESYNFKGRIGRKELIKRIFYGFLVFFGFTYLIVKLELSDIVSNLIGYPMLTLFGIFVLSSIVKRYNDFGKNRWYLLLLIIPYVNLVFLLFLLLKKGENY